MALGDYTKTEWVNGGPPGLSATRLNNQEGKIEELDIESAANKVDYIRNPAYGPSAGPVNAYTFASTPALPALIDGVSAYIDFQIANTGSSSLNWDGSGIHPIVDSKGAVLIANKLPLNGIVGVRFNASTGNFQLLGEGGEYGTALVSDVKNTKTIGLPTGIAAGTMPVNAAPTATITNQNGTVVVQAGYSPGGTITAALTALAAAVIKAGQTVGGILGTFTSDATATAAKILTGFSAYINGVKTDGSMPNRGAVGITPTTGNIGIADGYHNGGGVVYGVTAPADKIWIGTTIAGVAGTAKRKAYGSVTITSGLMSYVDRYGAAINKYDLLVTSLSFTPSMVVYRYTVSSNYVMMVALLGQYSWYVSGSDYAHVVGTDSTYYRYSTDCFLASGAFRMPVSATGFCEWWAYE